MQQGQSRQRGRAGRTHSQSRKPCILWLLQEDCYRCRKASANRHLQEYRPALLLRPRAITHDARNSQASARSECRPLLCFAISSPCLQLVPYIFGGGPAVVCARFCRKNWAKSVSSKPDRFVTDFDPALVQKTLHIPTRPSELDIEHHHEAHDFRATS